MITTINVTLRYTVGTRVDQFHSYISINRVEQASKACTEAATLLAYANEEAAIVNAYSNEVMLVSVTVGMEMAKFEVARWKGM